MSQNDNGNDEWNFGHCNNFTHCFINATNQLHFEWVHTRSIEIFSDWKVPGKDGFYNFLQLKSNKKDIFTFLLEDRNESNE